MFRGRFKQLAVAAGASVLVASASLAIVPLTASAVGTQTTSTTVTAHPSATVSGHPLTVVAKVAAVTGVADTPRAATSNVATGTVNFTISGTHGVPNANCKNGNTVTLKHGKATCKVLSGQLQAIGSPYTVTADYSGDATFAPSTGTTTEVVNKAKTHTKLRMGPGKPRDGTANAVTATVTTGHGGNLLSGTVTFSVSSVPVTGKTKCTNGGPHGSNTQPLAVSGNVGTAVCDLQPGWFVISKVSPGNKHPHGAWNVTASYSGDGNFQPSEGHKGGHSHS